MARDRRNKWGDTRLETARQRRKAGRAKREGLRLLCAGLIFAVCWLSLRCIPGARNRFAPALENLLTCSCDFEEAVRCFSARMDGEGDMGAALEEFCVTAFAAQTAGERNAERTPYRLAFQAALRYPETPSAGF